MIQFLSETTVIIATVFPLSIPSHNNKFLDSKPMVLQEYKSPTMNYDPMKEYEQQMLQKTMDKMLIDSIQE